MKRVIATEQAMALPGNSRYATVALRRVVGVVLLAVALGSSSVFANVLKNVRAIEQPGGGTSLVLDMADPASRPRSFTTTNPPRVVLDLPGTSSDLKRNGQFISAGVVKSMKVVEAQGRTRIIFDLTRTTPHDIGVEGNRIRVVLGGQAALTFPVEKPAEVRPASTVVSSTGISNIDFRRGKDGEGLVEITFASDRVAADVRRSGGRIVASFSDAALPENLERRFDVTDFGTPVTAIDAYAKGTGTELVISSAGPYEYKSYQVGKRMIINVSPVKKSVKESKPKAQKRYTGERLSLDFQDIEVRAVLKIIADFTDQNIVASDSVTGNITLQLKNVPWDEALDIILTSKGLDMRRQGRVILVAPAEEIAARDKLEIETQKQREELEPLISESIQVNYAKAANLAALLKFSDDQRGTISIDERTNRILVTDTYSNLQKMRARISELDIPVRQVMIESRIVIANNDFSRNLGARFGVSAAVANGSNGIVGGTGSGSGADTMVDSALTNIGGGNAPLPVTMPSLGDRYNVNLPVANPAGRFALALLGKDYLLDMELSALQMEGRGEVLSNPRVITSNRSEALIEQGVEIPYQQATSSGATSVSFKKAMLSLRVTPQITPDDRIIMDLNVTKDSVGQVFNGVPSINSREVKTQVLVRDGDTVVLGGIYEQTRSKEVDSVPFLGDLPVIGALFRQTRKVDDKAELLVFITPKIIRDDMRVVSNP